jgi:hypothetical protein
VHQNDNVYEMIEKNNEYAFKQNQLRTYFQPQIGARQALKLPNGFWRLPLDG